MLTKYYLHIAGEDYELRDDDLKNWDEIRCSYKRANYDGVVRSFTSQFQFVNRARNILLAHYLKNRYNAEASISVHVINDNWTYDKVFECPLDFSTVEWESYTFTISCIDSNLSAIIKANKSTKYELPMDTEMFIDGTLSYDRLPMCENATYEFTQGTQFDDLPDIIVTFEKDKLPWVGNVGSEIKIGGTIEFKEDQETDPDQYLLYVWKECDIKVDYEFAWRTDEGRGGAVWLGLCITHDGQLQSSSAIAAPSAKDLHNCGTFDNVAELPNPNNLEHKETSYAFVGETVYVTKYISGQYVWSDTGMTAAQYFVESTSGTMTLHVKPGDKVVLTHSLTPAVSAATIRFTKSRIAFSWQSRGDNVEIPVMTPTRVANTLLHKVADGKLAVDVTISNHDERLAGTYLFAAESARGIETAKFYSSFNEFCDWMSTVFGYIYYIEEAVEPTFFHYQECKEYEATPWAYESGAYTGNVEVNGYIIYISGHGKFFFHEKGTSKLYPEWPGSENYNDPTSGHARTDTLFKIEEYDKNDLYYFGEYESGKPLMPIHTNLYKEDIGKKLQIVRFLHRSEVLNPDAPIRRIKNCREVKYSVESSVIYSTITIGYDKKDFDSVNGRDEFNFNNTYTTGCTLSDKTLSMISKYRSDCYGIEFAVQKRAEKTTDTKSDKDVFFALCANSDGKLVPDRSMTIQNALSDFVFNGAFSPMACVKANAGYIGLQADELMLTFASSTGNSEIVIDGMAMNSNIVLDTPIATCGNIDFNTDDVDDIADVNELVEVEDDGITYLGYLKEVDVKYAKAETANYKLIVKSIEL